jgi:formylglycine-generating enzyme required for sulfatase activity
MDQDCPHPKICNKERGGVCEYQCSVDGECDLLYRCSEHQCVPACLESMTCPGDMVGACTVCIDRHEASRPDATTTSVGSIESMATSRANALPWELGPDNETAARACAAAGKRLCTAAEWATACAGASQTVYGYGDAYDAVSCNGIDTFGPSAVKLLPTGSFTDCTNGWGAYDLNGNLWEHVLGGSGRTVRGGAYNCIDSRKLHRCDYVPGNWTPSALGFRCCLTPPEAEGVDLPDASITEEASPDVLEVAGEGSGCLDPDISADVAAEIVGECASSEDCEALIGPAPRCRRVVCLMPVGACALEPAEDGSACDDGDLCTLGDTCRSGTCEPGPDELLCDDGSACTDDVCVADQGCVFTPNDAPCDDDDVCTTGDHCEAGVCVGGAFVCECETDADCPDDDDLCNGVLTCDCSEIPYKCKTDPASVVSCTQPADPCLCSTCVPTMGLCVEGPAPDGEPCSDGDPCTAGDQCVGGSCQPGEQFVCTCPPDMVPVGAGFCIDRYEASRPDATSSDFGVDESASTSRYGVLPWFPVDYATARLACEAAGKRLCTVDEVFTVCAGPSGAAYSYGDAYVADRCNGIDAFCDCAHPNCADLDACPYPHCRAFGPDGTYGQGCGAWFHVTPTGAFSECVDAYGAYDIVGNVWELVDVGTGESWWKGGAYNCGDSETLHRCDGMYQSISAKGFRCCKSQASGGG